jgi:peptide subunit release factor RF-3
MNPAHRDRLAFVRICSGKFTRGMTVRHKQSGRTLALAQPQQFVAQERTIVEEAYPGDVVGLFDPGIFAIAIRSVNRDWTSPSRTFRCSRRNGSRKFRRRPP